MRAKIKGCQAITVSAASDPPRLDATDGAIDLPEAGKVNIDVAFGGNFFSLALAGIRGLPLNLAIPLGSPNRGMAIMRTGNARLTPLDHPAGDIETVGLANICKGPAPSETRSKSVVIFGEAPLDR